MNHLTTGQDSFWAQAVCETEDTEAFYIVLTLFMFAPGLVQVAMAIDIATVTVLHWANITGKTSVADDREDGERVPVIDAWGGVRLIDQLKHNINQITICAYLVLITFALQKKSKNL